VTCRGSAHFNIRDWGLCGGFITDKIEEVGGGGGGSGGGWQRGEAAGAPPQPRAEASDGQGWRGDAGGHDQRWRRGQDEDDEVATLMKMMKSRDGGAARGSHNRPNA
jgi:hypothetical protein